MKETNDIITTFEGVIILFGEQYKFKSIIYIMIKNSIIFRYQILVKGIDSTIAIIDINHCHKKFLKVHYLLA